MLVYCEILINLYDAQLLYMDDDDELLPRAFAVTGELPPEAGPPTTGEDYLRRVRYAWIMNVVRQS